MALMNGARLGIAAQSVGLSQEAYNEGLAYARERAQFGQKIIHFPAVYDMLSRMKAKLDAGRSMLYQTARYVDLYKCLEDIQRDRKLTPEERTEMKQYSKLADAFTPIAKGMNSEYASQNAYDAISIHGGSGFIMEYKSQRLYRDARIFSIYEGTTQLQVVAAIRYITNGTYLQVMRDMLQREVSAEMRPLQERVAKLVDLYEQSVKYVNDANNQEMHDFLGRRLYDMTAEIIMALLLIEDASRAEGDLKARFSDSANVYTRMVEENVCAKAYYVMHFNEADLAAFRAE
jgi:alkylation response protein AidB-like acyl-CoA dehydrogenase